MGLLQYFGGKAYMMPDIIRCIAPVIHRCNFFVDVFGGSGKVGLSLPPEWKIKRIYNDLDAEMVRIIRWFQTPDAALYLRSPAVISHREVFDALRQKPPEERTPLESFYLAFFSFNGNRKDFQRIHRPKKMDFVPYCQLLCENEDFRKLIPRYDSPETFFYLDPPYLEEQDYFHGFTKEDFIALKGLLADAKGLWLLNHTLHPFIESLFGPPAFAKEYVTVANTSAVKKMRKEGFWLDYTLIDKPLSSF